MGVHRYYVRIPKYVMPQIHTDFSDCLQKNIIWLYLYTLFVNSRIAGFLQRDRVQTQTVNSVYTYVRYTCTGRSVCTQSIYLGAKKEPNDENIEQR